MTASWLDILRQQAEGKTQAEIARELGYSPAVVSQVLGGRYQGSLDNVAARVASMYGVGGQVQCPELGVIAPGRCADSYERAHRPGIRPGNPQTARLAKRCRGCPLRQ